MSTIRVNNLQNTSTTDGGISINASGHVTVDGVAMPSSGPLSNRNLVINGAMQVAQRGTTSTSSGYQTVDRFTIGYGLGEATFSVSQDASGPSGFSNCFEVDITAAETAVGATEEFNIQHKIEAQNLQHLDYGASTAKQLTLSFWVRSSVTGTYAFSIYSQDGNRIIGSTYTISSANTWEYKTITFAGDTGGTLNDDNGEGLRLYWWLAAGSDYTGTDNTSWSGYLASKLAYGHTANNFVTTLNANWRMTGVQLEVGSVATPFEHRSYGDELRRCQRYYQTFIGSQYLHSASGGASGTTNVNYFKPFIVAMRSAPTFTYSGLFYADGTSYISHSALSLSYANTMNGRIQGTLTGATSGQYYGLTHQSTGARLNFTSEL